MPAVWVNGVVSVKDQRPYVQLSDDNRIIAQLTTAEARSFAMDILQMAARAEADAMIYRFFSGKGFPETGTSIMREFRDFRALLDAEVVERGTDGV